MQFSGLYSLIPKLPYVLHEEEEGGHTSSAEIKLLLYRGFFYIQPSFPGSSMHLSYCIAGNFRGRKLLQIARFCHTPKFSAIQFVCNTKLALVHEEENAVSTSGFV